MNMTNIASLYRLAQRDTPSANQDHRPSQDENWAKESRGLISCEAAFLRYLYKASKGGAAASTTLV